MKSEIEKIGCAVRESGNFATVELLRDGYAVMTNFGWLRTIYDLNLWMDKVNFRHPFTKHKLTPNV